jgi:hemolysin-activating ACP:hemolysin acyltransferase
MGYRPPPAERAIALLNEITDFMQECGGPYEAIEGNVQEHILICLALGQFYYSKGRYFVCWWMLSDEGLRQIEDHTRPSDLTTGESMYVPECGVKEGMSEMRRKLRGRGKHGIHWHRYQRGWKHFPSQKGGSYGKQ